MSADIELAHVVVVSDRCAAGTAEDLNGPVIVAALREAGYRIGGPAIVADGVDSVSNAIAAARADGATVIITTGGTGLGPRDLTPEGTAAHIAIDIPGIPEHLRRMGATHMPFAVLTRGLAGLTTDGQVVVNLPGSERAVAEAMEFLVPLVAHLLVMREGGDHG